MTSLNISDLINIKQALTYEADGFLRASVCLKTGKSRQCDVMNGAFRDRMATRRKIIRSIKAY